MKLKELKWWNKSRRSTDIIDEICDFWTFKNINKLLKSIILFFFYINLVLVTVKGCYNSALISFILDLFDNINSF